MSRRPRDPSGSARAAPGAKNVSTFLVIGLNAMGRTLARELSHRGATVTVADASEARVSRIKNEVGRALVIDTTDRDALRDVHAERFEHVIVCMGHQFEASELTTLALRDVGVEKVTAVATTRQRRDILKALGAVDVVTPGIDKARNLAVELSEELIHSFSYVNTVQGFAEVIVKKRVEVDQAVIAGLRDLGVRFVASRPAVAENHDDAPFEMPGPETIVLKAGDRVLLFGGPDGIVRAAKKKLS